MEPVARRAPSLEKTQQVTNLRQTTKKPSEFTDTETVHVIVPPQKALNRVAFSVYLYYHDHHHHHNKIVLVYTEAIQVCIYIYIVCVVHVVCVMHVVCVVPVLLLCIILFCFKGMYDFYIFRFSFFIIVV